MQSPWTSRTAVRLHTAEVEIARLEKAIESAERASTRHAALTALAASSQKEAQALRRTVPTIWAEADAARSEARKLEERQKELNRQAERLLAEHEETMRLEDERIRASGVELARLQAVCDSQRQTNARLAKELSQANTDAERHSAARLEERAQAAAVKK